MFMVRTQRSIRHISASEWIDEADHVRHHDTVPLAVVLTDLDGFAAINEKHGREAGARVLDLWEKTLSSNVPAGTALARLGGDEYALVLPGSSAENALILLEDI